MHNNGTYSHYANFGAKLTKVLLCITTEKLVSHKSKKMFIRLSRNLYKIKDNSLLRTQPSAV